MAVAVAIDPVNRESLEDKLQGLDPALAKAMCNLITLVKTPQQSDRDLAHANEYRLATELLAANEEILRLRLENGEVRLRSSCREHMQRQEFKERLKLQETRHQAALLKQLEGSLEANEDNMEEAEESTQMHGNLDLIRRLSLQQEVLAALRFGLDTRKEDYVQLLLGGLSRVWDAGGPAGGLPAGGGSGGGTAARGRTAAGSMEADSSSARHGSQHLAITIVHCNFKRDPRQ